MMIPCYGPLQVFVTPGTPNGAGKLSIPWILDSFQLGSLRVQDGDLAPRGRTVRP